MTFIRAPASIKPIEQTSSACFLFVVVDDDPLHICKLTEKQLLNIYFAFNSLLLFL